MTGIIVRYCESKGFGFIRPLIGGRLQGGVKVAVEDTPEVFFHISQFCGGPTPPIGAECRFTVVRAEQGQQAAGVTLVERPLRKVDRAAAKVESPKAETESGTITRIARDAGWGFISRGSLPDMFFHEVDCRTPFSDLQRGDSVTYRAIMTPKGRPAANDVTRPEVK